MLTDEHRYKLLRLLEKDPQLSQRALAGQLGLSLGKVNFLVQALIEKGHIKARNFRNHQNKSAYMYYLTPRGMKEKASVTLRFFQRKLVEFEQLKTEVAALRRDAERERVRHAGSRRTQAGSRGAQAGSRGAR